MRWSPPIPSGAAALTAWRELDRRTRRELLRATGPHPDPVVACVAVGYARTMLESRSRFVVRRMARALLIVGVAVVVGAFALALPNGSALAAFVPVVVVLAGTLWLSVGGIRFRLRLIRMENANAPALLAGETPMPVPPPAAGTPLSVAYDRGVVLRQYGVQLAAMLALAALVWLLQQRVLSAAWLVLIPAAFLAFWLVLVAYYLFRWVLPGRTVLVVDRGGLRFASGLRVPWSGITEIRIHPFRGTNRPTPRFFVIAFVSADPRATIARLRGLRRWNANRALEYYGSPVVLPCRGLNHTIEEIVAAATSFHPVPVRRFGA